MSKQSEELHSQQHIHANCEEMKRERGVTHNHFVIVFIIIKVRAQMLEEISAYNTDLSVLMTVTRDSSTYTSLINNITGQ